MKRSLGVATRIWGGFIVILALLLLVALNAYWGGVRITSSFITFNQLSDNMLRVAMIDRNLSAMRRNVVGFAYTGDESLIGPVRKFGESLRQGIARATAETGDSVLHDDLDRMTTLLNGYLQNFERVVILRERRDELVNGRLNPLGLKVREQLTNAINHASQRGEFELAAALGRIQETLLLMRLNAVRFLSTPDPVLVTQVEEYAQRLEAQTEKTMQVTQEEDARTAIKLASEGVLTYQKTFVEISKTIVERNDLANVVMAKEAAQFGDLAERAREAQEKYLESLQATSIAQLNTQSWAGILISLVALVAGLIAAALIARSVIRPVNGMTGVMGALAANDLTVEVPYADRQDEMGRMARSVAHFKTQLLRVHQLEKEQEEQKRQAEADRKAAMNQMADAFENSVGKVVQAVTAAVTELQASASQMASTATETSAQATAVAAAAQEASANVQTVASASEELSASIGEIAHQVERSQQVAAKAETEAEQTTLRIKSLSEAVGRIGDIVNLINHIASQTNLLALNATIEAARAGEAGKGFAVVASEVKGLANQTAKATDEIIAHIRAVEDGTAKAVEGISSVASVIGEMNHISASVASAVEQQAAATTEIARNVEQAAAGTQEVTRNIGVVEQAAGDTGAAAEQIKGSAGELSEQAEFLSGEVGRFLDQIRSDRENLTLIRWEDAFATGQPSIDRHHRALIDTLNRYFGDMVSGDGGRGALALIDFIDKEIVSHFAEEEAQMRRGAYAGLARHAEEHRSFMSEIANCRTALYAKEPEAASRMFNFVATWTRQHFTHADRELAAFLRRSDTSPNKAA